MPRATVSCPCRGPHKKKASPPEVIHTLTWRFFRAWCSETFHPLVPGRIEHQEAEGNYGRWKMRVPYTLHYHTLMLIKCGEMKTNRLLGPELLKAYSNYLLSHSVFTSVRMWHPGAGGPNQNDPNCSWLRSWHTIANDVTQKYRSRHRRFENQQGHRWRARLKDTAPWCQTSKSIYISLI